MSEANFRDENAFLFLFLDLGIVQFSFLKRKKGNTHKPFTEKMKNIKRNKKTNKQQTKKRSQLQGENDSIMDRQEETLVHKKRGQPDEP